MKKFSNVLWVLAFVLAGVLTCAAQQPASAAEAVRTSMTLKEIVQAGGIMMYFLAALSVAAVAMILYLSVAHRAEAVAPREFLHDLRELVAAGRRDDARLLCRRNRSPLSLVADTSLTYLQRTQEADAMLLKEMIEGEGSRQAALLQNQTLYLLDIAVIAPMVGLLGTVTGMLQAFNAVALDLARAKPMLLAGGVAQALITTIAGLLIGIPAMAFYAYFRNRVSKRTAQLETASADLFSILIASRNAR